MVKVGINGFGRIGRLAFRIGLLKHSDESEWAAINSSGSMPVNGWAHLTNYDTTYRKFEYKVQSEEVRDPANSATSLGRASGDPLIGYLLVQERGSKGPVLAEPC